MIFFYGESIPESEEAMDAALPGVRDVIARYEPKDVFNMDMNNV